MREMARRLAAVVLCALLAVGCASPAPVGNDASAPGQAGVTQAKDTGAEPVGSPWKDWFVAGVMSSDDAVAEKDDFHAAANRAWTLEQNERGIEYGSVSADREAEIQDKMIGLVEGEVQGSDNTARDLQNIRNLYGLYEDWDGRNEDGMEPIMPIVRRLQAITTLDQFTDWLCSDDFRLSGSWYVDSEGYTSGMTTFGLLPYVVSDAEQPEADEGLSYEGYDVDAAWRAWLDEQPVDEDYGPSVDGYVVEIDPPDLMLTSFMVEDEELADEDTRDLYREASGTLELAEMMLLRIGYDEDQVVDILSDALTLESLVDEHVSGSSDSYATYDHAGLERMTSGGFPMARIVDAYGYSDAGAYAVYDGEWLKGMGSLYTQDNLRLFVSHALVGLLVDSASLLDGEAYDAILASDGSSYLPEEYLEQEGDDYANDSSGVESYSQAELQEYLRQEKRQAMQTVQSALPTSFAKVFVEHFYDDRTNEQVRQMVRRTVDQYSDMLYNETWLSEPTRRKAVEKLQAIRIQVGYPKAWPDTSRIEIRGRVDGGSLFSEVRRLRGLELESDLELLRSTTGGEEYWTDCMDVNAYYAPYTNSITIGAGILGGDFWRDGASYEELLGATGMTIGHEISHAFDSSGAYFDKNGAYSNWWADEDLEAFEARVSRVEDALSRIDPIGEGGYDGELKCAEAMADLGGMKVMMEIAKSQEGFDYDKFFRAYAASWRSVMTKDDARELLTGDSHPLDRDRVNFVVREFDEFDETYGVKKGDGMWIDPADRVSVW